MKTLFIFLTLNLPLTSFSQVPHFHSTTNSTNENAGFFGITNSANDRFALGAATVGTGNAGFFEIFNPSNPSSALYVKTNGTGNAGIFEIDNPLSVNQPALVVKTNSDFGPIARFTLDNELNGHNGVIAVSNGSGYTMYVRNDGSGTAGFFLGSKGPHPALEARSTGSSDAFVARVNSYQGGSNIASFKDNETRVARIDKDGVGYFNGGTQNSGADLAEAFDVWGDRSTYEPGDVLVISQKQDRSVEKSGTSYSDLIAGVYATKPGVLLTEESIDADLSDKLPMGIVGVLPTKVCDEGGVISRGDILVTASRTGYAMKGDRSRVQIGQVLGKALENFDGHTGKIKVLLGIH